MLQKQEYKSYIIK